MILLNSKKRLITILIVLVCGIIIFILGLGATGLVDETPPLFAAAARAMSESGDWLTPKVNGIFRFDKPPLIYWLMGFFYSLPKNEIWSRLVGSEMCIRDRVEKNASAEIFANKVVNWLNKVMHEYK